MDRRSANTRRSRRISRSSSTVLSPTVRGSGDSTSTRTVCFADSFQKARISEESRRKNLQRPSRRSTIVPVVPCTTSLPKRCFSQESRIMRFRVEDGRSPLGCAAWARDPSHHGQDARATYSTLLPPPRLTPAQQSPSLLSHGTRREHSRAAQRGSDLRQ